MKDEYTIVGLGELLWDILPSGRQLGGAPANFAYVCSLLGDRAIVASRIGRDPLADEALSRLETLGLSSDFIQRDDEHPTGTINVSVSPSGEPTYTGTHDAAWDHLAWTPAWERLAGTADAVGFGSLAQRSPSSRATIMHFLKTMRPDSLRLFDINLRHSFFSNELLLDSIHFANLVKLNDAEVARASELLGWPSTGDRDFARRLIDTFALRLVAITRGSRGSLIAVRGEFSEHPGVPATVVDTVGAGDAFGAAMVHGLLRSWSLAQIGEFANQVGAWMTEQIGATPSLQKALDQLEQIRAKTGDA